MDMAETDLQSIIEEWNKLRDDGVFFFFYIYRYLLSLQNLASLTFPVVDTYTKGAYEIPQPPKTSIQDYVNQLDDHLRKLKN